jgi:heptosyltransferase-2
VDLAQRGVTLGALKAVMQRAQLLVTNDTGPRHIAAAFGTPSVVFFGPTDRRWTVLPGVRERHLVAEPFLLEECIADDHPEACTVDRIALGDALFAADALLSENQTP